VSRKGKKKGKKTNFCRNNLSDDGVGGRVEQSGARKGRMNWHGKGS